MDYVEPSSIKPSFTAASLDTVAAARDHNSRRPIHQLPVELLAAVLKDSIYYAPYSHYHIRLKELSQVAWYWRNIIETTPSMWSVVSGINPTAVITAAIEKSKMSLLDIDMSQSRGLGDQIPAYKSSLANHVFLDLVYPLITQWRSFHLRLRSLEPLITHLQDPAPNLEELTLERPKFHSIYPKEIGDVILFAGSAPRLQRVSLGGISFQWCSALLRGLKSLALEHMTVSWSDLFDVLYQCPGLAHLSFVWLHGHLPSDLEPSSTAQITLAHLLHIRLEDIPVFFASCILHPRQMEYCRRLEVRRLTVRPGMANTENLLLAWLDSVGSFVTRALQTSSMADFTVTRSSFSCRNATGTSGQFVIRLHYLSAHAAATWLASVSETTGHLTTHLRLSDLPFSSYFPNSQLGKALQRLPKVTGVELTDQTSITLLEQYQGLTFVKPPSRSFVFPSLRRLRLKGHWDGVIICNLVKERYAVKGACADLAPLKSLDLGTARGFSEKELKWLAKKLGPGVVRGEDLPPLDQSSDTEVE